MPSALEISIPFADLLDMRRLSESPGTCTAELVIRPELTNSWGVAHGGAVASLLDMTLGMSAKTLDPDAIGSATIEFKVNFIAAATGRIRAEARATRAGRSLVFAEGEVRSESGELLAKATGTFKLRYPRAQ
ncbi:MAG: hotdog fold thioesterase [Betaproteobacteria bacterium]|nr:hotdog fold thioesterase [Betaproteobacteria bacterium]